MADQRPLSHMLLDELEPLLADLGFKRTGRNPRTSFVKRTVDGAAHIHVVRDNKHSAADYLMVTVDLASSLNVLEKFDAPGWNGRIGHVMPVGMDHWWKIRRDHFKEDAQPMIDTVVGIGASEAVRRASPTRMRNIWAYGPSDPFEDEFYRYFGLALLHRRAGCFAEADEALDHAAVRARYAALPEWHAKVESLRERFSDPLWKPI